MTHHDYNTVYSTRPEDILPALIEALKEGKEGVQIITNSKNGKRIVDVPDKNELLILQEIIKEYEDLTAGGNNLTLDGEQENVRSFINGLISVVQLTDPIDVRPVRKNRQDVENELVQSLFKRWDGILEESSDKDAPYYGIVFNTDVEVMRTVFRNAVSAQLLDASSSEDDFLYYFGRLSSVTPTGKLKWLRSQVELVAFIVAFSDDSYKWEKSEGIFLVRGKDGKFQGVDSNVLKQSYSRDYDQSYGKAPERIKAYRKTLLPCEEKAQS